MAACAQCGTTLPRAAKACPECGTAVPPRVAKPAKPATAAKAATAAKPAKPAVKAAKPAKAAATAAAEPRKPAKRAAKAVPVAAVAEAEAAGDAAAETPVPRRRAALASDGSAPRRRALHGARPGADVPIPPIPAAPDDDLPGATGVLATWAGSEALGDAEERDPNDPVVPLAPVPPGLFDGPGLLDATGPDGRPLLVARVLRGNWRRSVLGAAPAVAAAVVLTALAAISVLVATRPGGDELVIAGEGFGRWVRYVFAGVGLAFGSPVRMTTSVSGAPESAFGDMRFSIAFVPLTVTLLALAILWLAVRATLRAGAVEDWVADSVRTAAVFAVGVAAVTAFGRWSVQEDPSSLLGLDPEFSREAPTRTTSFAASAPKALFWAFLAGLVVVALAHRTPRLPARWASWGVAVRGALVGVGVGVGVGFVAAVVLGYLNADRVDATGGDVTKALPIALGYAVNLGTAAFGIVAGGELVVPLSEDGALSLWASWIPNAYAVLLAIPLLSVVAGAFYITRRGGLPPAEAARACTRMALPAAVAWGLLALGAAIRQGSSFAAGSAGPRLWDALLVGLWFGVVGWAAGRMLTRGQHAAAFDQPEAAPVP